MHSSFKVQGSTKIKIPNRDIVSAIAEWVERLSARDQANLLIWRMYSKFSNDFMQTGQSSGAFGEDLFSTFSAGKTREDNCITQLETFFPGAYNDMLVAKYVDEQTKNDIKDMFNGTVKEFEHIIDAQEWMSKRTKIRAKKKV